MGRRKLRTILSTIAIADRELKPTVKPIAIVDPKICGIWRALIYSSSQDETHGFSVRHTLRGHCTVRVHRASNAAVVGCIGCDVIGVVDVVE